MRLRVAGLAVAAIGWMGLVAVGVGLYQSMPRKAGFDLELVLAAGRRLAAGSSPYDASLHGTSPAWAVDLFYTNPPPIAQAATFVGGVPTWIVLAILGLLAIAGLLFVADRLAAWGGVDRPTALLLTAAALPFVFPFSVALLFGNLDVLVPAAYGLVLVALLSTGPGIALIGGLALAVVTIAKLSPGLVGLWLVVRATQPSESAWPARTIVATAMAAGVIVIAISVLTGGFPIWSDYAATLSGASGSNLIDPRNIAPAASLAGALGLGEPAARWIHLAVIGAAVAGTVTAARILSDPLTSLLIAAAASIVLLPVTWIHYVAALIPFAIAVLVRAARSEVRDPAGIGLLVAALVLSAATAVLPVIGLLAAGAVVAGAVRSTNASPGQSIVVAA